MIQKTRIIHGGNVCELLSICGNSIQFARWFIPYHHSSLDQYCYKIWKFANCTPQACIGAIARTSATLHSGVTWRFQFGNEPEQIFTEAYKKYCGSDYKIFTLRTGDLNHQMVDFYLTKLFKPEFVVEIANTRMVNRVCSLTTGAEVCV